MSFVRGDGRKVGDLRPIRIEPGFISSANGSALIECGRTRVICTATIENSVPIFLRDSGRGWITAEYGMLPGSGNTRISREATRGRVGGRTQEIQRLIGRSLRAVTDLEALGPRTIWVDCDVIEADGGTRTASVSGAYIAVALAVRQLLAESRLTHNPLRDAVAAVSVGIVAGVALVDLCYEEDSRADVDMNLVMTGNGRFVEVQGTAEGASFDASQLNELTALGTAAIATIIDLQQSILSDA